MGFAVLNPSYLPNHWGHGEYGVYNVFSVHARNEVSLCPLCPLWFVIFFLLPQMGSSAVVRGIPDRGRLKSVFPVSPVLPVVLFVF